MGALGDISERISAAVVGLEADDLQALADLHGLLEQLTVSADADARSSSILATAGRAGKLLEQLMLREASDAAAALAQVSQSVSELRQIIDGAVVTPSEPAPQPVVQAPAAPAAVAAESSDDQGLIRAEDAPLVLEFISEARGHLESAEAAILQVESNPDNLEAISAIFRAFHTIKGVAGFLNLQQIGSLAHAAENLLDRGRQGQLRLEGGAVDLILESIDLVKVMIAALERAVATNQPIMPVTQLSSLIERLNACAAGQATERQTSERASAPAEASAPAAAASSGSSADATVKVSTDRLDSLINMVGELVIAESMVRQDVSGMLAQNQRLGRNISHLAKITRELQELSMSMRMVPVQGVFQKMARLVRDLARKAGKQIEMSISGGETELDRNVVEAISDPLVHMIRNAVDHGVETPEQRQQAGKSATGHVELRAFHQGGNIVIEIRDDGRGLNRNKIFNKAVQAGLISADQQLSDAEVFAFIFHAGLSTAEKITDVSGRGVGMDVVKRNIEALRGRIEIASEMGKGTTFTIRLPLTLAVIDGLVVKVGQQRYILPLTSIEQSIRPQAEQISTVQQRGEMCMVRGNLLPVARLHRIFRVDGACEGMTDGILVIVQDNQRRCCLLVDELLGQQQVVIKSLGEGIGHVRGVSGGAILGDGNVSMILDVPGLLQMVGA